MKKTVFFLLLCAAFIFFSCKKDKEDPKPDKSSSISHKWKNIGYYSNGSLVNAGGDTLELKSDGSALSYKKPILNQTGTWIFNNSDQTNFKLTLNSNSVDYDIVTLDDNNFTISNSPGYESRYVKIQ